MIKILKSISVYCLSISFTAVPVLHARITASVNEITEHSNAVLISSDKETANEHLSTAAGELYALYDNLHLDDYGLSKKAFDYGLKGYDYLLSKKKIFNSNYLTICDFSQSSRNKRLYVIDLKDGRLLINTYVAHGRNSGGEYATRFSNRPESLESSLGFYVTGKTYYGEHGLTLNLFGVDYGFNNRAAQRKIVLHGADYAEKKYLNSNQFLGRSFGCPAVPQSQSASIINFIKNGTCLFIYHPTAKYLHGSKILNG